MGLASGVGDADLLPAPGDGGVGINALLSALQGHPGFAQRSDGTGSGGVILDGHIVHRQLRVGIRHHLVPDGRPQGVIVHGAAVAVGQGHGAALPQGDGAGQLLRLGEGDLLGGARQPDLVAAVAVVRQGGVGVGGGHKHHLFLTGEAVDGAPGVVGQQTVFARAVVLPLQALGVHLVGVGHQGRPQNLLHGGRVGPGGDHRRAVLELGDGLLPGGDGRRLPLGFLTGKGRRGQDLEQHQRRQTARKTPAEPQICHG